MTLGTTTQTNNRSGGGAAYTLNSGTLNLTTTTSLANVRAASGTLARPTLAINGGTLNNTSGSALTLAASPGTGASGTGTVSGSPSITIGGDFAFGTGSSTSANNLNLGNGAITNAGNRTITFNGTGTTLTMGGTMTNTSGASQTTTVNGAGNTLSLGGHTLGNGFTNVINGTGNVNITGAITHSGGTSGLTYSGSGTLTISGNANTFSGATTINSGTLAISSTGKLYSTSTSALTTVNSGGTLEVYSWAYGADGSIGNPYFGTTTLAVNGGTIRYTGVGEDSGNNQGRVFAIGTGGATLDAAGSGTWLIKRNLGAPLDQTTITGLTLTGSGNGIHSNNLVGASGTVTKSGSGTWTLSGTNTYTGATTINAGTLIITGATQATSAITFNGGSLGFDTGFPVTAASAAVDLANGTIKVTGSTGAPSYTLLTAASITGTPVLAAPVSGYQLQVIDGATDELRLVQTGGGSPYDTWSGGAPFDGDANTDGVPNGLAFLLGAVTPGANATGLLPTTSQTGGNLVMSFTCLATADRGSSTLTLEYDGDLAGTWLSVPVPGAVGAPNPIVETTTTGSVSFVATDGGTNGNGDALINVEATISDATEAASGKLFGRLKGVKP